MRTHPMSLAALLGALVACGPSGPETLQFELAGTVSGLPAGEAVGLALNGAAAQVVEGDGAFTLSGASAGGAYELRVAQQPASAYCLVARGTGAARAGERVSDVRVRCSADPSAPLFDQSRVQRLRLTVSVDEWEAFILNTERSGYVNDAFGWASWNLWQVSEIYRRGTLDYLDDDGQVTASVPDVGFRMRGNTSRMWPEVWEEGDDGLWRSRPRRFHLNLKFDETFDGDESAYACIDAAGNPAVVPEYPCNGILAEDIPAIPGNKDRTFMGLESFALKYNKDDPGYVREVLAHTILNDAGVPAGRAVHAALELVITPSSRATELNGRPLPQTWNMGVFDLIEPIDKPFVQRRFGQNGYVFKVGGGDLTWGDAADCLPYETHGATYVSDSFCRAGVEQPDPVDRAEWLGAAHVLDPSWVNGDINASGQASQFAPYRPIFDLKTKKSSVAAARVELARLIAVVSDPAATAADLESVLDVDGFITAQAVDIALGAVDHYARVANNYYLYLNPDTGRWVYMPYDYDFTLRDSHPPSWGDVPAFREVVSGTIFAGTTQRWRDVRVPGVNPRLYDLVFESAANRQKLLDAVSALRRDWLDWDRRTGPVLARWLERLEPHITALTAADADSGDTAYRRQAALGNAYTYDCWVSPDSPLATSRGGPYPPDAWAYGIPSTDTVRQFVIRRSAALATEAP